MTLFGANYQADRASFVAASHAIGATLTSHAINASGPDGESLTIDTARVGPKSATRLLVVVSGTHGVEGPAGSAVQRHLLHELLPHLPRREQDAVLFIHALNPYGYAWHRRQNEDNVDLNRNFHDFSKALPRRADYAQLDVLLNPAMLTPPRDFLRALHRLSNQHGRAWVQRTLITGQYEFRRGMYFGGHCAVESNRVLHAIFAEHASAVIDGMVIDIHTGMGKFGDCLLLPGHAPGSDAFISLARAFSTQRFVVPTVDEDSPAVPLSGRWPDALHALHPHMRFITIEFGTVDDNAMIVAEWQENWLHHHGDRNSGEARAIIAAIRATSCPDDAGWRTRVIAQGTAVVLDGWRSVFGD